MLQTLRKRALYHGLPDAVGKHRMVARAILTVAVGVAYFLAARLSLFLLTQPDGVAVFWPAAGVSSGLLIALGRDARWPVAIGTIVATIAANLTSDRTIWASIAFACCNAGEALLIAWLIERFGGRDFSLDRVRHVVWLLTAAIIGAAASGTGGAVAYKLLHSPDAPALVAWQHWFSSDAIGVITVAPLIIGIASVFRAPPPRAEIFEGIAALVLVAAAIVAVIFLLPERWSEVIVPVEMLFPLLLWLAARCRPAFTSAAVFIVSLTIVGAIILRAGVFGNVDLPIDERILSAQAAIWGVAIFAYILAALFAERRRHEVAIQESENRMRAIVNTVVDAIITIDGQGTIENLNPAAAEVFGYTAEEIIGRNVKILMPEPYRHEHDGYLEHYLTTGHAKVIGIGREVIGLRKNGSSFPMELAINEMAVGGRRMFTGVVRDITERRRAEDHQKLLIAELDHRVKNILAEVTAVAKSTGQGSRSSEEFLQALDGRIQSMAAAHGLLSENSWEGVDLAALVRNQLAPYSTSENITISGTDVILSAAEIRATARVLHELVTNAAKHGALSNPNGHVTVNWDRRPNGQATENLVLEWRELGGPPASTNGTSGYGTTLIRNLVPHELGGKVDLMLASDGVSCKIEFPLSAHEQR
jgi:PAS domain S-box-containing protein